jgi:hypothetical protein
MIQFKKGEKVLCMNSDFEEKLPKTKFPNADKIYTVRLYSEELDMVYLERIHNPKLYTKQGMCEIGFASWRFALLADDIDFQKFDNPGKWRKIRF